MDFDQYPCHMRYSPPARPPPSPRRLCWHCVASRPPRPARRERRSARLCRTSAGRLLYVRATVPVCTKPAVSTSIALLVVRMLTETHLACTPGLSRPEPIGGEDEQRLLGVFRISSRVCTQRLFAAQVCKTANFAAGLRRRFRSPRRWLQNACAEIANDTCKREHQADL